MNFDDFATFEISDSSDNCYKVQAAENRSSMAARCFINSNCNVTFLFVDGRTLTAEEVVDAWCDSYSNTTFHASLYDFVRVNTGSM